MRPPWSRLRSLLPFALVVAVLLVLDALPFDAVVLGAPLLLPLWLLHSSQRRLRLQLAIVAALCLGLVTLSIGSEARQLGAVLPRSGVLLASYYLFALIATFRMLAAAAMAAQQRWLPYPPARLAVAALVVATFLPILFCALQSHRIPLPTRPDPALPSRELTFCTDDGSVLHATLLTQPQPSPGIVVCHGLGANRAALLPQAELAARLGCQVLLIDFRGHGQSHGYVTTFGVRERRDVDAAITALLQDPHTKGPRVVLLGVSMGAATALLSAGDPRIAGVFAESAFADLETMAGARLPWMPAGAQRAFGTLLGLAARIVPGIAFDDAAPRAALATLPLDLPIALLHAGDDAVIPPHHGELLAAIRGDRLEVFANAGHAGCLQADPRRYETLLRALLARAFR